MLTNAFPLLSGLVPAVALAFRHTTTLRNQTGRIG